MFGKRPSEWTQDDVRRVVAEQIQEDAQVEFKGTLQANKGKVDPWVAGKDRVGEFARNKLIEEVIAFANTYLLPRGLRHVARVSTRTSLIFHAALKLRVTSLGAQLCWRKHQPALTGA